MSAIRSLSRRKLLIGGVSAAVLSPVMGLTACASIERWSAPSIAPLGQTTFDDYVNQTRAWMREHRHFVTADHETEIDWNAPSQTLPADGKIPTRAVLFVHGLGDSPWTYVDQAKSLAQAGWMVRTVLLPGHGTSPQEMLDISADDWRRVVSEQAEILRRDLAQAHPGEATEVWLGGFSTGCNLVLSYAEAHDWVSGLILFSPAVAVKTNLNVLAWPASWFVNWIRPPEKATMGGQTPFRYTTVPSKAFVAFNDTMGEAWSALNRKPFDRPVIAMMSQGDWVVDVDKLLPVFARQFTSPQSRFIFYGSEEHARGLLPHDSRLVVFSDQVPRMNIVGISHISLTYSPTNPHYGIGGDLRRCRRGDESPTYERCKDVPEDKIMYGSGRRQQVDGVVARLTFNPWFDEQQAIIKSVINREL